MRKISLLLMSVILVMIGLVAPQGQAEARAPKVLPYHLIIPSISLDLPVGEAPYRGNTWYIPRLRNRVEHLYGRWNPGSNGNVPIAGHVDFGPGRPGPFVNLNKVQVNDPILVTYNGTLYTYKVTQMWVVDPTDVTVLSQTDSEVLTLITCTGAIDAFSRLYKQRLVVRATLTNASVIPTSTPTKTLNSH